MVSYIGPDSQLISGVTNWDNIRKQVAGLMDECLMRKAQGGRVVVQSGILSSTLFESFFPSE